MGRILLIYLALITFAEYSFANGTSINYGNQPSFNSQVSEPATPASMGEVSYADMKAVKADGKNIAPPIMDFTKNPETAYDQAPVKHEHFKKVVTGL